MMKQIEEMLDSVIEGLLKKRLEALTANGAGPSVIEKPVIVRRPTGEVVRRRPRRTKEEIDGLVKQTVKMLQSKYDWPKKRIEARARTIVRRYQTA